MPEYTGSCNCGVVCFSVDGEKPMHNVLCHCRACSRAMGASPVHVYAVAVDQFRVTKGVASLKVGEGVGNMRHAFCGECGCHIHQHVDGMSFRAVFPVNFHIEKDDPSNPCGKSCMLPDELMPKAHVNYENRLMDAGDDLPKFTMFGNSQRLNNDGTKYQG
ncbi:hypothetical protein ACHAWF_008801 [Thalassiosira exigua]